MDQAESTEQTLDAAAKIEEVFVSFGGALMAVTKEQASLREALTQVIADRSQLVQLVEKLSVSVAQISEIQDRAGEAIVSLGKVLPPMDERIRLLATLLDVHHDLMIKHNWANPRPKGDATLVH